MSKRQGVRHFVKRKRTTDAMERAERWRASGAAVNAADVRAKERRLQSDVLMASEFHGVDLTSIPLRPTNEVFNTLYMLKHITGDDRFGLMAEEIKRMGLGGPDYKAKLLAMLPADDATRGLVKYVDDMRAITGSERDAAERAAVRFKVPSADFDGARQAVTLRLRRYRRRVG